MLGYNFIVKLYFVIIDDIFFIIWPIGGRATDRRSSDRPTDRPKNTTASDRKIVQRADWVPCLGKKFSMMPSDQIENSARWHKLNWFFFTFLLGICQHSAPYPTLAAALGPLACSSRSARPPSLPSRSTRPPLCRPNLTQQRNTMILIWFCQMLHIILRFVSLLWFIIKKRVSDRKPFYPLKGRSVGGSIRRASVRLSAPIIWPIMPAFLG